MDLSPGLVKWIAVSALALSIYCYLTKQPKMTPAPVAN